MAQNNNFVALEARPHGQRVFYATPRFEIFTNTDEVALQVELNDWVGDIALPVTPDTLYTIISTDFSTAHLANNVIEYSVLVRYTIWTPQ